MFLLMGGVCRFVLVQFIAAVVMLICIDADWVPDVVGVTTVLGR